ncbi:oxoglutarate dehydrogenase (succinyl-transferring) [Malassezia equina]|uniref:2-oxoglutarate dehydrogenase, mitochondrial n=1 Tax=Malassezia equina TaxID=1381935 RepID=A0AAF0E9H6_9BASI|nr:oxoglutarate dehydrogenase (succinyl-transferring) [Malassezia equina]
MLRQFHKAPMRAVSMSRVSTVFARSAGCRMMTSTVRVMAGPTPKPSTPSPNDSFATTNNSYYAEEMYRRWKEDRTSVHSSWDVYFSGMDAGIPSQQAFTPAPSQLSMPGTGTVTEPGTHPANDYLKLQLLVRAFQVQGHTIAKIDPLRILDSERANKMPKELDPAYYGWSEADLDKEMQLGTGLLPNFASAGTTKLTIREVIEACRRIYCGSIGYQYVHVPDRNQCDWLRERLEVPKPFEYSKDEKWRIFDRLVWSDSFERFIASKYPNEKRFGLEGGESMIPGVKTIIDRAVEYGVHNITMGMPHRGRLNVLGNVIRRPLESILHQFADKTNEEGGGDVKYHLGANYIRPTPSGEKVALSLVANPSHLEAEDPVVLGKTRALQDFEGDKEHNKSMALLMHGDAAFAGQGVVYETMGMYNLPKFATGGTIHIIVNNQIGFTTDPRFSRSTPYPSDIAKGIDAPIFHVNGDDVEAVNFVCQLAVDWRAKFKKDVVIDLVCYRRHGHNEIDQPSFTQPRMYEAIGNQLPTLKQYINRLSEEGTFSEKQLNDHCDWVWGMLQEAFEKSKTYEPEERQWLSSAWEGFPSPRELKEHILEQRDTGVDVERLKYIGQKSASFPEDFTVHRNLARILKNREKTLEAGEGIDMSTAEALAFGSLVMENNMVRVSGQDVERGTFSQRHAILHDQNSEGTFTPLQHLSDDQAPFTICNSSLSEFGALGFELGFSLVDPKNLTIWEAQFGDFANNAQCIIDQFIASGEHKWLQRTGLVVNLPHGYDGQGPEHSSARPERFLLLMDDHPYRFPNSEQLARQHQDANMAVVYCTTPANLFHVLRRQVHRDFRKPLINLFSKSLLRHPEARSKLEDMAPGTSFQRVIPEPHETEGKDALVPPEEIKRHILTVGQSYYALLNYRRENEIKDVAITRIEQIAPLDYETIVATLNKYPNSDLMFAQEEPVNNGAWLYLEPRLRTLCQKTEHHKGREFMVSARPPSSSVATGHKAAHIAELRAYVHGAFDMNRSVHDEV